VAERTRPRARSDTRVVDGVRVIRTAEMTLRYRLGAGPFDPSNLALRLRGGERVLHPGFGAGDPSRNLGGWYRGLDHQTGPVPLHEGLLSRDGWFLLDDTSSPLLIEDGRWYEPRPPRSGPYQDGYLFAYGSDYVDALRDFRDLTGPAPLLPRKAFGVWFSRYFFYSAAAYRRLVASFRDHDVPLDVLVVDTDFKSPNPWNGWQWTPAFSPDPQGFVDWAHEQGLDVALNVHPSISTQDPAYAGADAAAGGLAQDGGRCDSMVEAETGPCGVWDWARRDQVRSYFSLHEPFEAQGIDAWWLDWNGDASRAEAAGLTPDAWINSLYARRQRERGSRWLPLTRIGASPSSYGAAMPGIWAEHRNAIHFTGDTRARWEMLDFQSRFAAAEGAGVGVPYVSHDVGGFHADKLPGDMYVRWVQLGAFQPILRLHSHHGRRLPWEYEPRPKRIASEFLRLRESLIPYTYTLARQAYDSGMPIVRPMYLGWPRLGAAHRFDRQYMYGDELLVAPIATPGARAKKRIWFPPGEWVDVFTGERHRGPRATTLAFPLERMPVFARAGAIVPRQPDARNAQAQRGAPLVLGVYAGANGSFTLYEDSGEGLEYEHGRFARTRFAWRESGRSATLAIDRARGGHGGPRARRYELRISGIPRPRDVIGGPGMRGLRSWTYAPGSRQLTIETPRLPTARDSAVRLLFAGPRAG
jgi:alpha-glucosidase (family GH31 glycosyl hydrolase)